MSLYRVSLKFVQLPDPALVDFTQVVITSLTGNTGLPTPPVTPPNLEVALEAFSEALAAAAQGGKQATAAKNNARAALIALLRQETLYVQGAAGNDLAILLSSGFD